ncbi:MAG: hypothetical protein NTY02_13170 [Acidobacteria bacterium]|nr:hypothetical protein [Acidobacteriota bacterium]
MNVTGEPQYVEVWGFDSDKNQVGHALVVYKVEDSRLYVADPNYPGGKDETGQRVDRYIQFDAAKGFLPFSASATSGSSPLLFTYVFFAGKSSVVGWDTFGRRWDEFVGSRNALPSENARLIGHDRFPEYELQMSAPTKTTKAFDYGTVQTIVDNAVVEAEMIEVRVRCGRYNYSSDPKTPLLCATSPMRVIVYRDGRPLAPGGGPLAPGETITLRGGKNELGFLVEARVDEEWVWVDYKDYDIWAGEADNPCDGVTVADLKKGPGLSKMNVVLCSAKCMPIGGPMPSDAVLQACIDGRDAPKTPPETVLPPPPPPPRSLLHGTWSGTWTNNRKNLDGKYQSGSGSISLSVDANGVVTGSWDGVTIENGRRTGNTMTWTSKTSDGWRRWDVTVQIQDDENTLVVSYTGHDRETMYKDGGNYSGSATYRRK